MPRNLVPTAFLVISLLALAGCPGRLDSLANFDDAGPNPLAFTHPDIFGHMVAVGSPSDRTVVLFFNAPGTSDAMQPITTEVAVAYREADDIDFVSVTDLRPLSFYERPFAPGAMQGAHRRTINRINRRLDERGLPPIEGLADHLFFIADENAAIVAKYGVPNPNETITCVVFAKNGHELGRFQPQEEADLAATIEAIAVSLDGGTEYAAGE